MDKIRVAIICHFSNSEVRRKLKFFPFHEEYKDSANWITTIIDALKNREDTELHIVAPHRGIFPALQEFTVDNVHYHFYRRYLPAPFDKIERRVDRQEKKGFPRYRKFISRFIQKIKPDLVNLIGAENAYYACSVLDIESIPVFVHCQTVYANPERKERAGRIDSTRWNTELDIFHKVNYFACSGRMYFDLVKGYNPKAIIFPRKWPASKYPTIPDISKKYDFAYFARMLNKNKGFDNAIEAIAIAVKKRPEMKVLAVGTWDRDKDYFEKRIDELGIRGNIEIHPSFPDYIDMLQYVKQAKFALLPIKMDVLSGTIMEALSMGMPVVTCRTSGTPSLNKKRETILISDIGDNETLAANMLRVYEDPEYANMMRENGTLYIKERVEKNANNLDIMVEQYKAVIAHYNSGTPIPEEMLYDTEKT